MAHRVPRAADRCCVAGVALCQLRRIFYLAADGALTVAAQVGSLLIPIGTLVVPLMGVLIGLTVLLYAER